MSGFPNCAATIEREGIYPIDFFGGSTANADNSPAVNNAITTAHDAGGGIVMVGPGEYLCNSKITLKTGVRLKGIHDTGWPFRFPTSVCALSCTPTFVDDRLIAMYGADITGSLTNEGNCGVEWLDLSGAHLLGGSSVDGIQAEGEVLAVYLRNITVKQFSHNGLTTRQGSGTANPHDWEMDWVVCYLATNFGFSLALTDGWIRNSIASSAGVDGWFFGGVFAELTLDSPQALFNTGNGFRFSGSSSSMGPVILNTPMTDRNGKNGILAESTGVQPIAISRPVLRRDGRNGNSGGGGYAGLAVAGCSNAVSVDGVTVTTGVDDGGAGTNSPQYGMSITGGSALVVIDGACILHGNTAGIFDDGTNVEVRRGANVIEASGPAAAPVYTLTNGLNATLGGNLATQGRALGLPRPKDMAGASAWTSDPATISGGQLVTNGTVYGSSLYIPESKTLTKFFWGLTTAAIGPVAGQSFIALYTTAGVQLALVNVDARLTTLNGFFTETISVAAVAGQQLWAVFLFNSATPPTVLRSPNINAALMNFNTATTTFRTFTNVTAQTSLPSPLVPASNVSTGLNLFAAVA